MGHGFWWRCIAPALGREGAGVRCQQFAGGMPPRRRSYPESAYDIIHAVLSMCWLNVFVLTIRMIQQHVKRPSEPS